MIQIKRLKLFQSVKVGSTERTFFASPDFKIEYDPGQPFVIINETIKTTFNNVIWLEENVPEPKPTSPVRAPKTIKKGKAEVSNKRVSRSK